MDVQNIQTVQINKLVLELWSNEKKKVIKLMMVSKTN